MSQRFKMTRLALSWSTSRAVDTYGYNIARLDDSTTGARYRCSGGGYDMVGTVFGEWFAKTHQDKLRALVAANAREFVDAGYVTRGYLRHPDKFYGLNVRPDGSVTLDGACGIESMIRIVEACGMEVQRTYRGKGRNQRLDGFIVSEPVESDAQ